MGSCPVVGGKFMEHPIWGLKVLAELMKLVLITYSVASQANALDVQPPNVCISLLVDFPGSSQDPGTLHIRAPILKKMKTLRADAFFFQRPYFIHT